MSLVAGTRCSANIRTDPGFRQIVEGIRIRRKQLDEPAR